jgi:UDP-N-acetyl-2-amino-2-deoxyglucuronate dehydrogenase
VESNHFGFGIIGCGVISNWHANAIDKIPGACLVGVYDSHETAKKTFAEKYNVKAFQTATALFEDPKIDVVCICTPSGLHAQLTIQAANSGKHVIVEKPMALNLKEADDMIYASKNNQVKLAVVSQLRFSEAVRQVKNALANGWLGKLIMGDVYMKFYRSQEYYDRGGWRGTWAMDGGGALMNQGIHGVDLLQYLMGPVKTVFAHTRTIAHQIEVEDTVSAVLEFKNGTLGVIQAATSTFPGTPRRLEINGDRGGIILEEDSIVNWVTEGHEPPQEIVIGHTDSRAASDPTAFSIEGHIRLISDMLEAIKNAREPLISGDEGRKAVEIILAVYESSKSGKMVELQS